MVATVTSYTDSRNRAAVAEGFDGVVRLSIAGYFGTGVLLYDGRAILTAAHLFANTTPSAVSVHFETVAGNQTLNASRITTFAAYDATQGNNDLALVWLSGSAPADADRYNLYRSADEISQTTTIVGYGTPGTGDAGTLSSATTATRLKAINQFDADAASLKNWMGSAMQWAPTSGTQLVADFDSGSSGQDALGRLMYQPSTGLGLGEGIISPGDSGGPAFINGQIAGIASHTASLSRNGIAPDIDSMANSSFGEIGFWQRISHYQQWIDQSVRAQYADAPTRPADVQKTVAEGNSGISYVYFLVQFNGLRSNADQLVSVDFATRDGTAKAGSDYVAVSGTLVMYTGESHAVIPVEIIGDNIAEPNETLYLDVANPVGGSFGDGIVKLTAMRTIVNDDAGIWG